MEYLVIGAGPGGPAARLLPRARRARLPDPRGRATHPATFFRTFPRHRRLISINKPHTGWDDPELNLRMDWNSLLSDDPDLLFTRYSERYFPDADDLVRYLADFAASASACASATTRASCASRARRRASCVTDQHGRTSPGAAR